MTFREIVIQTFTELLGPDYTDVHPPDVLAERVRQHLGATVQRFDQELPDNQAEQLMQSFRGEFPGILNWMLESKILSGKYQTFSGNY
jgi:hypothetical protein